jgi:methyl halide transferase
VIPKLDAEYWNSRYLENDTGWDAGAITTPLKEYFDQLTDKSLRILIPGAGNAYEAEYLVNSGFTNVIVCDLAEEPLKRLKAKCPQLREEQLVQANFFDLELRDLDLIVEQTFFCAIDPSLRKRYFEKAHEMLKPGGKLVGLLFDDVLNTDRPPFGGNRREYLGYITGFEVLKFERCYNSIPPRKDRELFMLLSKQ